MLLADARVPKTHHCLSVERKIEICVNDDGFVSSVFERLNGSVDLRREEDGCRNQMIFLFW